MKMFINRNQLSRVRDEFKEQRTCGGRRLLRVNLTNIFPLPSRTNAETAPTSGRRNECKTDCRRRSRPNKLCSTPRRGDRSSVLESVNSRRTVWRVARQPPAKDCRRVDTVFHDEWRRPYVQSAREPGKIRHWKTEVELRFEYIM